MPTNIQAVPSALPIEASARATSGTRTEVVQFEGSTGVDLVCHTKSDLVYLRFIDNIQEQLSINGYHPK